MLAVLAAFLGATVGSPVEAERWADVVDRWQRAGATRPDDPVAEAWATVLRACLCRRGVEQMRDDADEAVARCAREGILAPAAVVLQGTARVLCGDLDGGDAYLEDAASGARDVGAHEVLAAALGERSLLAMARNDWDRAGILAEQAGTTLSLARIEDSYVTPLVCAAQARAAMHRRDLRAARQQLAQAQRLRALLTYALPYVAVQARIELARVHIALANLAGARMLMREADELLRRRPGLGTLAGEAEALRTWLSGQRSPGGTGTSALTAAELRLLPLLTTHLSFPEIAQVLCLSPHTVKSQAWSIYRKLGASSRSQMIARSRELGLLEE